MFRLPFSITSKLLLLILPLVCIPIAGVGYLSYQTTVDRVTTLSRKEQLLKAKAAAARIDSIFKSCRMDIETIVQLPIIPDYYSGKIYGFPTKTNVIRDKIRKHFENFIRRSPFYYQIRFLDHDSKEVTLVCRDKSKHTLSNEYPTNLPQSKPEDNEDIHISDILYSPSRDGYVIHMSKRFINTNGDLVGTIEIDIDYEKVIDLIDSIKVGEKGYAFMVDQKARTIAHPDWKLYEYDLFKYDSPRLREFIIDMMTGDTGWKDYFYQGEKTAAFAPIPSIGWSLAVTVPIDELKKEAKAIRNSVIQIVVIVLIISGGIVGFLSYHLVHPIRNLVIATERIAEGDLSYEIPVQSRDELGLLTQSFNSMVQKLNKIQMELIRSEKLISLGRLSSGVAHEIRNPLNAMKGAIVFLQKKRANDQLMKEYTQLVLEEIKRLNEFVTDFLYFSRQSSPKREPTDLNTLLRNTIDLFDEEFRQKGIKIKQNLDPSLPLVEVDPNQIGQVYINLIVNGIQSIEEDGHLELKTTFYQGGDGTGKDDKVVVDIIDNGVGIPKACLNNIFDPFYSTKDNGTGLGLPISLGIIEAHNGRLIILSDEGKGTSGIIELPLKE